MKKKWYVYTLKITVGFFMLLWFALQPPPALCGANTDETGILQAVKNSEEIKIDGKLDEAVWQTPPLQEDFITFSPIYGEKLPYKTLVWTAYDSKKLYFAFRCLDPEPGNIQDSLTKRDNMFNDDWVSVAVDAVGNGQTTYVLYVNPSGIQGDSLVAAVGREDKSPDFVWQSAAGINERGYQVEIALPLKSISFKSGKEIKMGLLFRRRITRLGYIGAWPDIKTGHSLLDSQVKVSFKDLKKQLRLEILPALTYSNDRERITMDDWQINKNAAEFGAGIKYGVTSSITAEVTVNPDFSQVESDAFQVAVNQRYPLFYSEKRPFFMEGSDVFKFYTSANGFCPIPVHTRYIIDPAWGAKITGNIGKISFGILSAGDEWPGSPWDNGVNPDEGKSAFFGIARGKYSLGKDNYFGFLYSGREFAGTYNRVLGADLAQRLGNKQRINISLLHSLSGDDESGREGADSRSNNFTFSYYYDTKPLGFSAAFEHIGEDFRMDSAYLLRTGVNTGHFWLGIGFYPQSKKMPWLKMVSPDFVLSYTHDLFTGMDDIYFKPALYFITTREGYLVLNYEVVKECWMGQEFNLGRFIVNASLRLNKWLKISGRYSHGTKIYYTGDPAYKGTGGDASLYLDIQPNRNLNQFFGFTYSDLFKAGEKIYDVNILYSMTTYQFNKYFFLRAVFQYDSYWKHLLTDVLASFTFIPGTVLHIGYGGLYENRRWQDDSWLYRTGDMLECRRSFFAKVSYLFRF